MTLNVMRFFFFLLQYTFFCVASDFIWLFKLFSTIKDEKYTRAVLNNIDKIGVLCDIEVDHLFH